MAPSRATLLRSVAIAQRLPTPRASILCRASNHSARPVSTYRRPAIIANPVSIRQSSIRRSYSEQRANVKPPEHLSEGELHIFNKVLAELEPIKLEVQDISGGCGSMYALEIESAKFQGLSVIKQHKLVNSILADEIKSWHGVQLRTRAA